MLSMLCSSDCGLIPQNAFFFDDIISDDVILHVLYICLGIVIILASSLSRQRATVHRFSIPRPKTVSGGRHACIDDVIAWMTSYAWRRHYGVPYLQLRPVPECFELS